MEIRKNNKKKSLIMNIMSIVLCLAMLAGATFAWFSDSAKGKNIIQTGNLDVALSHVTTDGGTEEVTETTKLFLNTNGESILWEPGVVAKETFVVENQGDLALIYELGLNAKETGITDEQGEPHYLMKYMKVGILPATVGEDGTVTPAEVTRENLTTLGLKDYDATDYGKISGSLVAGDENGTTKTAYTVVIYWAPQDDNQLDNIFNISDGYQIDLGIELNATQMANEYDSLGNGYDDNLTVPTTPNAGTTPDEGEADGGF